MSTPILRAFDVKRETEMLEPVDFNRRSRLKHVDRVFKATITSIVPLTDKEKLFHLRINDDQERERFAFLPGQFAMVEVPGYGEVAISISSSSAHKGYVELCIRNAGLVTGVLHRAQRGATVGLRGPFGSHFPMDKMKGHNVLLVAGGLGLAPLRAPIYTVTENRSDYDKVHILYGTREPRELLFDYQYEQWRRIDGVKLDIVVEKPTPEWKGHVGLVTRLLDGLDMDMGRTYAIVCGPPVMFKFVCQKLSAMGMPMDRMFVSLERRMHCGMGKCCRCNVGSTYVCQDGPVFDFWTVMNLKEAI
jgi:NAD(P)H-flavin reductase